jgi:hypothetical protein
MTRNLIGSCILSLAAGVAFAQGTATSSGASAQYTQAELKQMAAIAHTADQFKTLAGYYGTRHESYMQQAVEEKKEWERRSKNVSGAFGKYPRPVDSARNLYEYYMYKASEAGALEAKYSQLAAPSVPVNAE